MDDVKSTYREGEQTAKETWRNAATATRAWPTRSAMPATRCARTSAMPVTT